ncbi:MAG: hypothetical protein A3F91_10080 [Flavobacteria bacterium RIFCSPLOWO2_12_FULL_35_11]|nr:MAG: hypothetical protein A3F91_10080 [Flavobacteria bacterium RIFCSPLOWO2_12_FULL_35_11]
MEVSIENVVKNYLKKIKEQFPRYIRDHLQVILKTLHDTPQEVADKTLNFCLNNHLFNAYEFEQVLHVFLLETIAPSKNKVQLNY